MKKIMIGAGHYPDQRAQCRAFGLVEHTEVQKIVNKLIPLLRDYEIKEFRGTILEKVQQIKEFKPKIAIDIHLNGSASHRGTGVESLCHKTKCNPEVRDIADSLNNSLSSLLNLRNRGIKSHFYRGQPDKQYGFLRNLPTIGVIFEILFMDHKKDVQHLINGDYLKVASAIALGIKCSIYSGIPEPKIRS